MHSQTDATYLREFKSWFYSRGEFYQQLKVKFYEDGEPYFSSQGAECSFRVYEQRKKLVEDIFTCKYFGGDGTEYSDGLWQKKETPKTITFKQLKESFYQPSWTELRMYKDKTKNNKHILRDWEDGTYTIYPNQSGIPHLFEPILPEKIEEVIEKLENKKDKKC